MRDRKSDAHRTVHPAPPGHDVHHKDDNKENNDPMNLVHLPHAAHSKITGHEKGTLKRLRRALSMPARKERLY
jgi:hypothetical protein